MTLIDCDDKISVEKFRNQHLIAKLRKTKKRKYCPLTPNNRHSNKINAQGLTLKKDGYEGNFRKHSRI